MQSSKYPHIKGLLTFWGVALLVGMASCGREAPSYEPGNIRVESEPVGAAIFMDGEDTGQITPYTFADLTANISYYVSVRLPEFIATPDSETVHLRPLDFTVLNFTLSKTALEITSNPAGAAIFFDGEDTGRVTPATIANLEAGSIEVSLRLADFEVVPTSYTADVVQDVVTTLPADTFTLTEVQTAQRIVILEGFSNVNCGPCPELTANLVAMEHTPGFGPDKVLYIEFSVSWPNFTDPLYLYNSSENTDRFTEYVLMGAPSLFANGVFLDDALDAQAMTDAIEAAWEVDPGFLVHVAADYTNPTVPVTVTLEPFADLDLTGHSLYIALYEKSVIFATAPGTNGQTDFHHVFRDRVDVLPSLGQLTGGTNVEIEASLSRGALLPENLVVVAFVQRNNDFAILQAGSYGTMAKARGNQ